MAKIRKRPSMSASVEADAGKATEAKRPRAEVASKLAAVARSVQGGRSKPAPQLQKAMADPDVNILAKVLQKQLDSLGDAKVRGIEKNLLDFVAANGSLRMSSHCSGSNVAFLAAATVALKTTGKNCILNVYDVEKDKVFLENFEREMLEYDEHLTMTLDVYLEYLRYIVQPLHQQGIYFLH